MVCSQYILKGPKSFLGKLRLPYTGFFKILKNKRRLGFELVSLIFFRSGDENVAGRTDAEREGERRPGLGPVLALRPLSTKPT